MLAKCLARGLTEEQRTATNAPARFNLQFLNFKTIKGINSTTTGDFDPSFEKHSGLLGGNGFIPRLAETHTISYKGPEHPSRPKVKGEGDISEQ